MSRYPSDYIVPEMRLNRFIDSNAERAEDWRIPQLESTIKANGDYSGAPVEFYIQPPVGYMYEIRRALILVTAATSINSDEYITSGPLTNGVIIQLNINGVSRNMSPIPIKQIFDWGSYAGVDVVPLDRFVQSRSWVIRWSLFKSGAPIYLRNDGPDGSRVDKAIVLLNDNFTSLTTHTALFQGLVRKIF